MPLVVKRKATDALLDAELRHLSVSCTAKLISRNFSHDRRCCELVSSCPIFWLSLASLFRSSARALEQLFRPFPQGFLFTLAVAERRRAATSRHLPCVFSLKVLSELWSQTRLSTKELPRFFLSDLETLFYLRAFSPAVSLSPKVLKLHACDLGPHPGFVLASCFDEQTHDFVSQGDCFLSSRVRARVPSEPFRVTWDALTYWKRTADDNGEAAGKLRCDGGGFVVQSPEDGCILRRPSSPTGLPALPSTLLLVLLVLPLCLPSPCLFPLSTRRAPRLCMLDTPPGLERRRA